VRVRRALTAACVIVAAPLISACGEHTMHNADANNNGTFIDAGPLTYQLQLSRQLNQYSPEDSGYIKGLPTGASKLTPNQEWFGVFLWAKNETQRTHVTTGNFDIVDTLGHVYRPLRLNSALNPYAWTPQLLAPGATQPNVDTTAGTGPAGGQLLLFKLPASGTNSIYDNRPITLQIRAPSGKKVWARISLDL
jgi:hypothetical protein